MFKGEQAAGKGVDVVFGDVQTDQCFQLAYAFGEDLELAIDEG